jgi:glycolate oxidase
MTTSMRVAAFGHIGEGNIHLSIMSDKRENDVLMRGFIGKVVKEVVSIGGTLTAEQGVDEAKAEFVELELTDQEIGLMRDLKRMFDPKNIMNPGKIFT